jgi:hypothetical protein
LAGGLSPAAAAAPHGLWQQSSVVDPQINHVNIYLIIIIYLFII